MRATQRSAILTRWGSRIQQQKSQLASVIHLETGKPIPEAVREVESCAEYFHWFAGEAVRLYGETIPSPSSTNRHWTIREPLGVAAIITPWNFPMAMLARKLSAALAAGCTIVAKPSEKSPLSGSALLGMAVGAGLAHGVVNLVAGDAVDIVGELCANPLVRQVSFTGSTTVGGIIQKSAIGKRLSLELGGNAPFIVCEDANLHAAVAELIQAKFRNCGQTCVAPNRVLVHKKVFHSFTNALLLEIRRVKFVYSTEKNFQIGPLISTNHLERVQKIVSTACAHGGRVVYRASGIPGKGSYYPPTVVTGVSPGNPAWHEEVFGPVIFLSAFESDAEAIQLANDTNHGLAAYVFTESLRRSTQLSEGLQFGMIGINESKISNAAVPFGGCKGSGMGKEGSKYGTDEYSNLKLCSMRFTMPA
ncbi:Succinate-semialdehyde dehydrogenase [Perkinsela sp. CCAP 1560/4]|nr:Succinate-semialdehyde dehydrogenase [Perkinsela sp. CCAP 1560/4]|eukprot:KNH02441.1 Succinate-semialdehyde dehydrogenase [Perkinsela sp. CCAP 1560/4]